MNGITQVRYLEFLSVPTLPPPSQALKNVECVLRSNNVKYRCTGTAWEPVGSSSVGALDATSPISGNPSDLDTPGKLAAAIQTLQAKDAALDLDGDGRIDANKQQDQTFPFPAALAVWTINHNLGRRPAFELFDLANNGLEEPPRQDPTLNTTIFRWLTPQAGQATAI